MGELATSRSLGDLPYIDKGISAEPDVSAWHGVAAASGLWLPEFLLLASDGLFETLTPVEACTAAHTVASGRERTLKNGILGCARVSGSERSRIMHHKPPHLPHDLNVAEMSLDHTSIQRSAHCPWVCRQSRVPYARCPSSHCTACSRRAFSTGKRYPEAIGSHLG